MTELIQNLGYVFRNKQLLEMALTHRSFGEINNERLEFLGDSIVNLVMAEALFHQFDKAQEGDLTRWRASLINRDTLAELAREFKLGRYMRLGMGELKSGGTERSSILSCAMEAVIGAIYLDSDFDTVKQCLLTWYQPWLQALLNKKSLKDPKTELQEFLQAKHKPLPIYTIEAMEGEAHNQIFTVSCYVEAFKQTVVATGTSRRRAEQQAASLMLGKIKQ